MSFGYDTCPGILFLGLIFVYTMRKKPVVQNTNDKRLPAGSLLCARARAIENECYVALTGSVGTLLKMADMDNRYSQSAVFIPSDSAFGKKIPCLLIHPFCLAGTPTISA